MSPRTFTADELERESKHALEGDILSWAHVADMLAFAASLVRQQESPAINVLTVADTRPLDHPFVGPVGYGFCYAAMDSPDERGVFVPLMCGRPESAHATRWDWGGPDGSTVINPVKPKSFGEDSPVSETPR